MDGDVERCCAAKMRPAWLGNLVKPIAVDSQGTVDSDAGWGLRASLAVPYVQNTPKLSASVAHLGLHLTARPSGSARAGFCCGQPMVVSNHGPRLFIPKLSNDVDEQGCGLPELGSTVAPGRHRRWLYAQGR